MAQRESEATRTVDLAYVTESLAIRLVTHPESPGGPHTTQDEWQLLQYIRQLIAAATNDETADDLAASIIKLGVFAPSVQRKMRQLCDRGESHHDNGHDEPHGMRR